MSSGKAIPIPYHLPITRNSSQTDQDMEGCAGKKTRQRRHLDKNNCCQFCGNPIPITGKLQEGYKQDRFQFVS